jgi:hypothetical protein
MKVTCICCGEEFSKENTIKLITEEDCCKECYDYKTNLLNKIKSKTDQETRERQLMMFYRNWGNKFGEVVKIYSLEDGLETINR